MLSHTMEWFARETGVLLSGFCSSWAKRAKVPIAVMARVLGVSKASYYAWAGREPSASAVADLALLKRNRILHLSSRHTV